MALKNYYQEELDNFRELAGEFAKKNPAIAPLLGSKGDDPDVERLLEGVAFMSGLVRQSIDEGFPQLIQSLLLLLYPQALLPTPSATMMLFQTMQGFVESIRLRAGSEVASIPVNGSSARFTTTTDLDILPAVISSVTSEKIASGGLSVSMLIRSPAPLSAWLPKTLSIYCAGDFPQASERRSLILRHSTRLEVGSQLETKELPRTSLEPGGLYGPPGAPVMERLNQAMGLMHEYFTMPQKFLFLELSGIRERVNMTERELLLRFVMEGFNGPAPNLRPEHFLLNVVPAVNIFRHQGVPIIMDHKKNEYLLRPQDSESGKIGVYRVREISGRAQDGSIRPYVPFERNAERAMGMGSYTVSIKRNPISGLSQHYITVHYFPDSEPLRETLSVSLDCNNIGITDELHTGEINVPTDSSPAMATFSNILAPTRYVDSLDSQGQAWNMLSHLYVNLTPLLTADTLRELLEQYSLPQDTDISRRLGNRKRLEAIVDLTGEREDHFVKGRPIHGYSLKLTMDRQGFASLGDMHLFGDVLDRFFGLFHHINTYSRLTIIEKNSEEVLSWTPRLGTKRLI